MKAKCIKRVRLGGLEFEPDREYDFEEQAFTEEYNPAMHPTPARGHRIRYIRCKFTMPMPFGPDAFKPGGMVEVRTVFFYDLAYCLHHNWHDEQGNPIECFDHHFAVIMHKSENFFLSPQKKQLYTRLPQRNMNPKGEIEMPADIVDYMKRHMQEQMYKMFGGLIPADWDYDRTMELYRKKKETKDSFNNFPDRKGGLNKTIMEQQNHDQMAEQYISAVENQKQSEGYTPDQSFTRGDMETCFVAGAQSMERLQEGCTGTFGQAIGSLRNGFLVRRQGWNGKGTFLFMCPFSLIGDDVVIAAKSLTENFRLWVKTHPTKSKRRYFSSYICLKAADGSIVNGWLPSQTDMLTDDWELVNPEE